MTKKHSHRGLRPLPPDAALILQQAIAAHQAGRLLDAEGLYRRVLGVDPKQFPALMMLGILRAQSGNFPAAERQLQQALRVNPNDAGAQFNHGNVLLALERHDDAFDAFGKALALNPAIPEAHLNRGGILMARKRYEEAIGCFDAAIRINPAFPEAHCNRGAALEEFKRFDEALASYEQALALNGRNPEFHASRANVLHRLKRYDEALAGLSTALTLQPQNAGFHYNKGNILSDLKRYAEAFQAYDQAFVLDPKVDYAEGDRFYAKMMICDWTDLAADNARLVTGVEAGRLVVRPFAFLSAEAAPGQQTRCANLFTEREYPARPPLWKGQAYGHDRIRVAYLSADFREHPVAHLLAGMFEHHDRQHFETVAVSFGRPEPTPMRQRLEHAFERFIDVHDKSDAEIARTLHDAEVDIVVDLMGPTQNARPGIFAYRPAPVQALYLGYAGSSGAPYMDYLIADSTVIPEAERALFREQIVHLPDCFMGADRSRAVADAPPSRADEGLPETGFVFCAFANSYKITPPVFDVWMELLRAVEGSVLWLSGSNETAVENLRRAAHARGVAPERLVFARRVARNADHLARHRLAGLFLDTAPFGAHSTANDALWAGLPVVALAGPTFAGRVAASLLKALGVSELVTDGLPAYKALALRLAREPDTLAALRAKVAAQRATSPLFDTARFTRHIESAFTAMVEQHRHGLPPAPIAVPPADQP